VARVLQKVWKTVGNGGPEAERAASVVKVRQEISCAMFSFASTTRKASATVPRTLGAFRPRGAVGTGGLVTRPAATVVRGAAGVAAPGSAFTDRLQHVRANGEAIICAEGYLFEMERRGWVQIGPFVPEVVLTNPEAVKNLHREFLRAGSDVMEAFTYYGNRAKLKLIGKEHLLEDLNRQALRLAREVAEEGDALMAGNVCNTTTFDPSDPATWDDTAAQFEEQCRWAAEEGADYIIGETFETLAEANLALEAIRAVNLPAVITFATTNWASGAAGAGNRHMTHDGLPIAEACKRLEENGAAVVGLNCTRGPGTMLPILDDILTCVSGPVAALPVGYRTTDDHQTFQELSSKDRTYTDLDPHVCTRYDFDHFTKECLKRGVAYIGTCCGGAPHHVRAMAEAMGRSPPATENSPDLSKHFVLGTKEGLGDNAVDHNLTRG